MRLFKGYLIDYFLGRTCKEKVETVRGIMEKEKASALILTALDEIACEFFKCF